MDRRDFLRSGALLAGALCLDLKSFAQATTAMGKPHLRVGILSDIHIRLERDLPVLKRTFEYFRDREVDAVLIAGDMADTGLERQMRLVATTWFQVFPKDRLPNGHHVERLFVYGNHDIEGHHYGTITEALQGDDREQTLAREAICDRREQLWKKYYHEKFQPIYIKEVKGYKFIGAHWTNWQNTPGLQDFLTAHAAELQGSKPFFYFQHPHPKNTCSGEWAWGQDNGEVTEALSHFPNCIAFSGHSHQILNDERTIWQGAFTSVGTASLSYTYSFGGRENTYIDGGPAYPTQMPSINQSEGKQGMVMTVYDNAVTLERWDFMYQRPLADNWIIPLPTTGTEKPLSFEQRARKAVAPQFAQGDRATVSRAKGKDRQGKEQMQTTVHFPNVLKSRNGQRAFDFEVTLEEIMADVSRIVCQKRVMSPHFFLSEEHDQSEVTCVFGENEVPVNFRYRFCVRPCECFGKKGDPIYTDWQLDKG